MYTVSNYTSKEKLLAELSAFYQIPIKSLLTPSQGYKVSYFNKELIIIVIALLVTVSIFILVNLSSSYQKLNKQYAIQQTWRKEGKLLILNSVQSGTNNNQIFNSWYKEMRRNNGVYYINSNIIDTATIMNTSHNKKIHDNQTIKLMTVNRNFIHDYLPELDTIAKNDFLVPNKLNTQYMAKVLRKKRYDDLSSTQQKKFYKTEKAISIKSYSQELNLISYNPTLQRSFVNPIIEIVDDNHLNEMQQLMLANTDVNSVLKIVGNQANRQKIAQLNKDPRYKPLGLKFAQLQSVLANVAADFSQQFRIFFEIIALTTVISIFTTLFLSLCIIYDRQKELAIKRLLGYRRIDSYKYEFAFLLVLASIETITLLILHVAPFALLLALSLACLDIIIFYLLVGYLEKKNLVQLLKGGSL